MKTAQEAKQLYDVDVHDIDSLMFTYKVRAIEIEEDFIDDIVTYHFNDGSTLVINSEENKVEAY